MYALEATTQDTGLTCLTPATPTLEARSPRAERLRPRQPKVAVGEAMPALLLLRRGQRLTPLPVDVERHACDNTSAG